MLNVHYQLALTYEPVHLSLYVAEQGARFLRTQSQMSLQRSPQPAAQKLHITSNHHQRLTRSFLVFQRKASKPGNDMSRQPKLISFILLLVKPLPLLAPLLVVSRYEEGLYKKNKNLAQQQ